MAIEVWRKQKKAIPKTTSLHKKPPITRRPNHSEKIKPEPLSSPDIPWNPVEPQIILFFRPGFVSPPLFSLVAVSRQL